MQRFLPLEPLYVAVHNAPCVKVDALGLEAWEHTKTSWTPADIAGYRAFVKDKTAEIAASGTWPMADSGAALDCSDFASYMLVEYASENGLPVYLIAAEWSVPLGASLIYGFQSWACYYRTKAQYLSDVYDHISAYRIYTHNSVPTAFTWLRQGDLLIRPLPGHVQVVSDSAVGEAVDEVEIPITQMNPARRTVRSPKDEDELAEWDDSYDLSTFVPNVGLVDFDPRVWKFDQFSSVE